jgi:hypothetical protein
MYEIRVLWDVLLGIGCSSRSENEKTIPLFQVINVIIADISKTLICNTDAADNLIVREFNSAISSVFANSCRGQASNTGIILKNCEDY